MAHMKTIISILTALAFLSAVHAEEPKRGESVEAQKLTERARDAKQAGRYAEAAELSEKAEHLLEKQRGEKPGPGGVDAGRLEKARHEIEELHRAGRHEEAEQLKRHVAEGRASGRGGQPTEAEGPAKLRHIMEAIHHLREAGLDEPAEGLEKLAHKLREDVERREREHAGRGREPEKHDLAPRPPAGEMHAMREQIEKLGRAVDKLRAQLNRRGGSEEVRRPRE